MKMILGAGVPILDIWFKKGENTELDPMDGGLYKFNIFNSSHDILAVLNKADGSSLITLPGVKGRLTFDERYGINMIEPLVEVKAPREVWPRQNITCWLHFKPVDPDELSLDEALRGLDDPNTLYFEREPVIEVSYIPVHLGESVVAR